MSDLDREYLRKRISLQTPSVFLNLACDVEDIPQERAFGLWDDVLLDANATVNLYLHVPFCASKCRYCMYRSVVPSDRSEIRDYVEDTLAVLDRFRPVFRKVSFHSFYFGGGTVTTLDEAELDAILGRVDANFRFRPHCERTVEFNPASCTLGHLRAMRARGISRVSCGIQTFRKDVLEGYCRQPADPAHLAELLAFAREEFPRNAVDLLIGLEGQSEQDCVDDVAQVLAHRPGEVSCYRYEPRKGDPGGECLARYRAIGDRLKTQFSSDYEVLINEHHIHLLARDRRFFDGAYSMHLADKTHTLGIGRFAGSRIAGIGEYTLLPPVASFIAYPPDYERYLHVLHHLLFEYRVDRGTYRAAFGEPLEALLGARLQAAIQSGGVEWSPDALVATAADRIGEVVLQLLPDAYCRKMVQHLVRSEAFPVGGSPSMATFVARLFGLEEGGAFQPLSVLVQPEEVGFRFGQEDGTGLLVVLRKHIPDAPNFGTTGRLDVVYREGELAPSSARHLQHAVRILSRYQMEEILGHLERLIATTGSVATG